MPRLLIALLLLGVPALAAPRVVSLSPSTTEIMLELDAADLLVGVLDGDQRPSIIAALPSVGRFGQLSLEALVALEPDLLLLWPDSIDEMQRQRLRTLNIPLLELQPLRFEELEEQFAQVGRAIGRAQQGERLQQAFHQRVEQLRQRYRREQPLRVFYQVWDQPLFTVGGRQIISDALRLCGAENIFADLTLAAPQISVEAVIQRDPQVILVNHRNQLAAWARWTPVSAVRHEQVWLIPDRGLERPSFQMIEATEKLCELLEGAQ